MVLREDWDQAGKFAVRYTRNQRLPIAFIDGLRNSLLLLFLVPLRASQERYRIRFLPCKFAIQPRQIFAGDAFG